MGTRDRLDEPTANGALDPIEALVARWVEAAPADRAHLAETLAAQHPDLATELQRRIRALEAFGLTADGAKAAGPIPDVLGDFRLRRCLGGGGMGVVYLAEQISVARPVALKLVRPELLLFAGARERFQREVRAIGSLQHPGIVTVYTVGESSGLPFYAMERVEGCTLSEVLDDLPTLPREAHGADVRAIVEARAGVKVAERAHSWFARPWVELCLDLVGQVADALDHAHARGVVHRDVKPSNIMLTVEGRARLIDFGISSQHGAAKLTRTTSLLGSLPYMSPEQFTGAQVDHRTDVYSLGVTLYELLTRQDAFPGQSHEDIRRLVLEARPRRIRDFNSLVSWEAEVVCATAMAPERGHRYATAAGLARDLDAARTNRPIQARPAGTLRRLRRFARRSPARAALIGVLVLVVPALVVLGGLVVASAGDRRLAQETRRQRLTDQELALGLLEGYHRPAAAMAALERALALAPERADVVATLVMASGRPEWQLARLEQHGELVARRPSLAAAKADVLERLGRTDEAAALRARLPPPATADDFFVLALRERHKADAGDRSAYARGAAAVTRAILLAPTPQCAHFVLRAELVSALGDRAAIEDTTAAIERHWPDSPSALALCALALSEVDQGRGIAVARRAVALDPTHARAQGILGQLLADAGAVDEGIACVREAIRLAPDFVQARLSLAVLLYQKGDAAASTAQLRVLLEEEHLGLMIRVIAHRHLAPALLATGDGDGAAATLQLALELAPDDVDLHLDLGKVYTQLGRVDDAVATYAAAMTLAPERADLHHDFAYARLASGQVDDAIAGFERALELAPRDALALANLGQAFRRNGDLARAVDALQRAVAIDSNHASAHRWLVEILREVGDTPAARAELQRWADQHPADAAAWNDLAWFLVDPAADADQRDPRAGLAAAERAAELSERREAAYLDTLAWATFHAGDHAAAVAIEEEALAAWRASGAGDSKLGQELEAALVRFRAAMAARR